jgi:hypothetical protein
MNAPDRPDVLTGRKLPAHSLWEQLLRLGRPLVREFCSQFFNSQMSYPKARQWLAGQGIEISVRSLGGFYNSRELVLLRARPCRLPGSRRPQQHFYRLNSCPAQVMLIADRT